MASIIEKMKRMITKDTWAVVSYWVGEDGDTDVLLFATHDEAAEAFNKLYDESRLLAKTEDDSFDEEGSVKEGEHGVVAWKDGLVRYFEVRKARTEVKL